MSGACVAIVCASGCPATVSNCVHRPSASSDFACGCAPGYYSRLALQPAPRQIPSGWSEGSAPTPVPAPARVTVHVASPAPVPIVFVNTTEPAPPPPPAPNLLGGFTPSCRDLAVDIKTQSDLCDPDDVVFQYFMPITQEAQVDAMKTGFNEQLVQQLWIDSQSKDVEVQFVIYNGNLQLFAVTTVVFEFDKAGGVSSKAGSIDTLSAGSASSPCGGANHLPVPSASCWRWSLSILACMYSRAACRVPSSGSDSKTI